MPIISTVMAVICFLGLVAGFLIDKFYPWNMVVMGVSFFFFTLFGFFAVGNWVTYCSLNRLLKKP